MTPIYEVALAWVSPFGEQPYGAMQGADGRNLFFTFDLLNRNVTAQSTLPGVQIKAVGPQDGERLFVGVRPSGQGVVVKLVLADGAIGF